MTAVANYVDSDGPLPGPLREAFRMQRYGPPFAGGYRQWPLRWLKPVSTALNVYDTLTAVGRAMSQLDGERLQRWTNENGRAVRAAAAIQQIRAQLEDAERENGE